MPYGKQPTWPDVKTRFRWNWDRLFDRSHWSDINPYARAGEGDFKGAERTPWEDFPHSLKNLVVEWWRLKVLKRRR